MGVFHVAIQNQKCLRIKTKRFYDWQDSNLLKKQPLKRVVETIEAPRFAQILTLYIVSFSRYHIMVMVTWVGSQHRALHDLGSTRDVPSNILFVVTVTTSLDLPRHAN